MEISDLLCRFPSLHKNLLYDTERQAKIALNGLVIFLAISSAAFYLPSSSPYNSVGDTTVVVLILSDVCVYDDDAADREGKGIIRKLKHVRNKAEWNVLFIYILL